MLHHLYSNARNTLHIVRLGTNDMYRVLNTPFQLVRLVAPLQTDVIVL